MEINWDGINKPEYISDADDAYIKTSIENELKDIANQLKEQIDKDTDGFLYYITPLECSPPIFTGSDGETPSVRLYPLHIHLQNMDITASKIRQQLPFPHLTIREHEEIPVQTAITLLGQAGAKPRSYTISQLAHLYYNRAARRRAAHQAARKR